MAPPVVPSLPDAVRSNYLQIKAQTGRTWDEMAAQFERDAEPLVGDHAAPYRRLAAWARAEGAVERQTVEAAEAAAAAEEEARKVAEEEARKAIEAQRAAAKVAEEEARKAAEEENVTAQREGTTPGQDTEASPDPKKRTAAATKPTRTA
jgi:hypothetical protein